MKCLSNEGFGEKILVPVDGSNPSNAAVERACELAKLLKSQITLIHVVAIPYISVIAYIELRIASDLVRDSFKKEGSRILEESGKLVEKNGLKATTILEDVVGNPGRKIVEVARKQGFNLIVIGARGHTVVTHLLGSVSDVVLHNAPCCVLIVR